MALLTAIYIASVLAGLLPVIFRRLLAPIRLRRGLLFVALQHLFFLDAESRFVSDHAAAKNGGRRPPDFDSARSAINEVSHSELPLAALLFAAFTVPTLVPYRPPEKP